VVRSWPLAAYTGRMVSHRFVPPAALAPLCAAACAALLTSTPTPAATEALGGSKATAGCERAVREALGNARGPAPDVAFNAPPAIQPGAADATEQVLRGAGRVRGKDGARGFSYSCNVDPRSGEVSGVVVRDNAPAIAAGPVSGAPIEPDLSHVSPAACESDAAAALKRRWPNVIEIRFDPATRALQQDSASVAMLRGQGNARPFSAAPATHFSYRCEIDPRNGRISAVRVGD
jgi:hypothetical protein